MVKKILLLSLAFVLIPCQSAFALSNPTHFVDTQWNLFDAAGYNSIEVDITPEIEESTTTDGYYFANTVYFRNYTGTNFGGAYAGFQTNGYSGSSWIGKMALFSVWDVSSGVGETGGWATPFGGEGTGFSVRIAYNWQVGRTYRLKIYIDQDAATGDRLWAASLTDLTSSITTRIGRVYVPVARGKIYGPVTFHERYLGPVDACSSVKKSQVSFTNMTANNGVSKATTWNNYYIAPTPECPGLAWLLDTSIGVQSGIATTKPIVAPKPTQTTIAPTPQKAQPKITSVPETPKVPAPVVADTQTVKTVAVDKQPAKVAVATPPTSKKPTTILAVGLTILVGMFVITNLLIMRSHMSKKKFNKYLAKHFPFDPDAI